MAGEVDRLFVYGTLMRGECRQGALGGRRNVVEVEEADVAGRLVDCGSYPGLVPDDGSGRRVSGEVVRVRDAAATLARLDRIEDYRGESVPGSLYLRVLVEARLESGGVATAWTYVLADPKRFPEIPSGSWRARRGR